MSRSEHEASEPRSIPAVPPESVDWVDRMLEGSASEADSEASPTPAAHPDDQSGDGSRIGGPSPRRVKRRWMIFAMTAGLFLIGLAVAGIVLVTRPSSTVDQLLILTVPSGATVTFDSQELGPSPVKLEGVRIGTHSIEISKEGYKPVSQVMTVTAGSQPLDFKLEPIPPEGMAGLSEEEQIKQYQYEAEQAFARGNLASPYEESSALYFADLIIARDPANQFGVDMKEKVRRALLQIAQNAMARADLAQAQDVVAILNEHYPTDEAAKAAAAKLESQIALHKGDVRDLVKRAEEALQLGDLIEPQTASAYYFSKQALAIDRSNSRAKSILDQVRATVVATSNQLASSGDRDAAEKKLQQARAMFPKDQEILRSLADLRKQEPQAVTSPDDPAERRLEGLEHADKGEYARCVYDLQYTFDHGLRGPEVVLELGRCYLKEGDLEHAVLYLKQVPASPPESSAHVSALAMLGEIAAARGDSAEAIQYYSQARDLGGSIVYSRSMLDEKISKLERSEKAASERPTKLAIEVKHEHGGVFHGSCNGELSVDERGVRFDGKDHHFSANLVNTGITVRDKNEIIIQHEGRTDRFRAGSAEAAAAFKAALDKYQVDARAQ